MILGFNESPARKLARVARSAARGHQLAVTLCSNGLSILTGAIEHTPVQLDAAWALLALAVTGAGKQAWEANDMKAAAYALALSQFCLARAQALTTKGEHR